MKEALQAALASPMTYVLGFALLGASSIVAGAAIIWGAGPALIAAGAFLLVAAGVVVKGMKLNG